MPFDDDDADDGANATELVETYGTWRTFCLFVARLGRNSTRDADFLLKFIIIGRFFSLTGLDNLLISTLVRRSGHGEIMSITPFHS